MTEKSEATAKRAMLAMTPVAERRRRLRGGRIAPVMPQHSDPCDPRTRSLHIPCRKQNGSINLVC